MGGREGVAGGGGGRPNQLHVKKLMETPSRFSVGGECIFNEIYRPSTFFSESH